MLSPGVMHLTVRALGVDIALEVEPRVAPAVERAWADALVTPGEGEAAPLLTVGVRLGDDGDVYGNSIDELLHHLSPVVTQRAIAARAGELVMLHASALADLETGATAVLVAPSGTGKTTASSLLGAQLAYLTDETAGITLEGAVLPYRKPLSIIESGHLKTQRAPRDLGLLSTDRHCHLAALLVIERQSSHEGDPLVVELDTVDALAALAPECSFLGRLDRPLQRLADVVQQAGRVRHVTYAEASTLIPLVRSLLDGAHR